MATICMLTFCRRSPTGRITVSPGPRVSGSTRPNLKRMPCSYCCTILNERAATTRPEHKKNPLLALLRGLERAAGPDEPRHDEYYQDDHQGDHHQHLFFR